MNDTHVQDALGQLHVPSPGGPEGALNQRGGRIDIEDWPGKSMVDEAEEESFPASDAPCYTPAGYSNSPPARRPADGGH